MTSKLDTILFPKGRVALGLIAVLTLSITIYVMGRQIWGANWWLIDDHEIFMFLGDRNHLPFSELFSTMLAKTEVGTWQGRYRPVYYFLRILETCLWGNNVHLWYLTLAVTMAIFIGALWWALSRFLPFWLSLAALIPVITLYFWSDIWTRLGPCEIYGAPAMSLMIAGIVGLLSFDKSWQRTVSAIVITASAIVLIGSKETFLPMAAAAPVALIFAAATKRLSALAAIVLVALIGISGIIVVAVVYKELAAAGTDIYANKIDESLLQNAVRSSLADLRPVFLGYLAAALVSAIAARSTRKSLAGWWKPTALIFALLAFMSAILISQYLAYRTSIPTHTRYDFPAMLFRPFVGVLLAWYCLNQTREYFGSRKSEYASVVLAILVIGYYLPSIIHFGSSPLMRAANENVRRTHEFFSTVEAIVSSAKQNPSDPVLLEAYGAGAYEPIFSMQQFLSSLGVKNPISIRLYPDAKSMGVLYDGLEATLRALQDKGSNDFQILSKSLETGAGGRCISIGMDGPAVATCAANFEIKW